MPDAHKSPDQFVTISGRFVTSHPQESQFRCFKVEGRSFHLVAIAPGYQPLVTEIHFQGDPKKSDPMYRIENAIAVETHKGFESGVFDIVLEREKISG